MICGSHQGHGQYLGRCIACDIEERREGWQARCLQSHAVCRYLRGEVERLEAEVAGWRGFNGPLIRAWDNDDDELYNALDELRGELNYPGEVTHE